MRKLPLILLSLLAAALIAAMPFLCSHSDILPEVSTAYYDHKAKEEALTATGPEAELMRMLTGLTADTKLEPISTPLKFSWFGLALAIGTVCAIGLLFRLNRKRPNLRSALLWTAALAVPLGMLGARLVYTLVNIPFYVNAIAAPEAMLNIWEGGLSLAGALAFITLAGVVGAKAGKAHIGLVLDAMAGSMVWLVISVTIALRITNMGFGPAISGSFLAVSVNNAQHLDTAALVVFALSLLLIAVGLLSNNEPPAGHHFALTAFLYGTVMILLESLRKDGHMVWGFVHAEMLLDLLFALPALLYLARTKKRILWSLLATAAFAGAVIALEFALDRSSIGDGVLYGVYIVLLAAYGYLGYRHYRASIK